MFKRKLFKRALPVILSVAMVFQSMPATALAAESRTVEESVIDNSAEESTEESKQAETGNEPAEPENSPNTEEPESSVGSQSETPGSDENSAGEASGSSEDGSSEETGLTKSSTGEELSTTEEDSLQEEIVITEDSVEVNAEEGTESSENAQAAKIAIQNNIGDLGEQINAFTRVLNAVELTFNTTYVDPVNTSKYGRFEREVSDYINITVADEDLTENLKEYLTYTWQSKKADSDEYADIAAPTHFPTDVNAYRLRISLNAVDGVCDASEPVYVNVNVEKAEIALTLDKQKCLTIEPGKKVQDLIDQINENYVLAHKDQTEVDRKILKEEKLPLTVYKVEKGTRKVLDPASTEVFSVNADYVVTVDEVAIKDEAANNYAVSTEEAYSVVVGDLRDTRITYTLQDPAGKDIVLKFAEGKEFKIDDLINDGTIAFVNEDADKGIESGAPKVVTQNEDSEWKEAVEGAVAEAGWYTRKNTGSDIDTVDYEPMTGNPKDAGEYYIIWKYAGDEGAYKESESEPIRVTIDPISVVITADAKDIKFYDGMDADDVAKELAKLTYSVCPVAIDENGNTSVGEDGKLKLDAALINSIVKDDFFGVSYAGDDELGKEQYYRPLFGLERCLVETRDKEGLVKPVEEKDYDWQPYDGIIYSVVDKDTPGYANDYKKLEYDKYQYRIIFTGDKVVYDGDGDVVNTASITDVTTNSANKNYLADITRETRVQYAVEVTVETAKATTIDTTKIVDAFTAAYTDALDPSINPQGTGSFGAPAVKIYDGEALFKNRSAYKQAAVNDEEGKTVSSNADEKLTYTWTYLNLNAYDAYDAMSDEEKKLVDPDSDFTWYSTSYGNGITDSDDGSYNSCKGAAVYRLTVHFEDPNREYKSSTENVYFKVEQQEIVIIPDTQYAQKDEVVSVWQNYKLDKNAYTVYKLPKNNMEEFLNLTDADKDKQKIDKLNGSLLGWEVKRQEKNTDGSDTGKYISLPGNEFSYPFDEMYQYGVVAYSPNYYGNYTTIDKKLKRSTGEEVHHELPGEIVFYAGKIYPEIVDKEAIKALTKTYDGKPVTIPADVIKLYSDEELKNEIPAEQLSVNTTDTYDPAKVNVFWRKLENGNWYDTKNAIFGGTYQLVLSYAGSKQYAPLSNFYEECSFTINKRDITITPNLKESKYVKAGDFASELLVESIDFQKEDTTANQGVIKQDEKFFTYTELDNGSIGLKWGYYNTDTEKPVYYGDGNYSVNKEGGYPAFYWWDDEEGVNGAQASYIIQIDGKDIKDPWNERLRWNKNYTVKLVNGLVSPLDESYHVIYNTKDIKVDNKGTADITGADTTLDLLNIDVAYDYSNSTYSVKPREAVKFVYDESLAALQRITVTELDNFKKEFEAEKGNRNWLAFRIYAPKEFEGDRRGSGFAVNSKSFILENSIKAAGGYILGTKTSYWNPDDRGDGAEHYITVLFPLTKEDKDQKTFNITWADGYTDTFSFSDIVLEADLRKAVAPKSMKFNGVNTKMAVGETQQLDLQIVKAQLGDVVSIRYRLQGGDTKNANLSIDPETGVVTALRVGKATTVEAYPVYIDADGKAVPVKDNKGKDAKAATVKISVADVAAPVIKKIDARDISAGVWYDAKVKDGYRREVYVVDATTDTSKKKWKVSNFEELIKSVKNGQYKEAGFVSAPDYRYDWTLRNGEEKTAKLYQSSLSGLETGHTYVVYVRNVSAARTLDDGSVVDLSHSGAVKSFVTTKSSVQELLPYFDAKVVTSADEKAFIETPDKKNPVYVSSEGSSYYKIPLSAKTAQLKVDGLFIEQEDGNNAAEWQDMRKYALQPLDKTSLSKYQIPKLTYGVFDTDEIDTVEDWKNATPSKYATINNKGKISIKGVDWNGSKTVYVYVMADSTDRDGDPVIGYATLTIKSNAATVTGKKVKMKVGQTIYLTDYLEYKDAKKKKIPNYRSSKIMITDKMIADAAAAGYLVEDDYYYPNDDEGYEEEWMHRWKITAVSPNKTSFKLDITDRDTDGNEMTASVMLTSAQLDSVKGLKTTYVDNQNITINFTHAANVDGDDVQYAVEVKDARGNVVETRIIANPEEIKVTDAKLIKSLQTWIQYNIKAVNGGKSVAQRSYDDEEISDFKYYTGTKAKTYAYTFNSNKLVRLSAYTISVTPVYNNQKAAKAATAKAKTTNIPASWHNRDIPSAMNGGESIYVATGTWEEQGTLYNLQNAPYRFVSGNTYTLRMESVSGEAKDRVTDTLTWKSSNTKVAAIKANPGTYTAAFKALNKGETTITVTSKITKKVIARYAVQVKAVGNGSGYRGDYEPTWDEDFYQSVLAQYDPYYEGRLEVLTESTELTLIEGSYDRTWVSFTAPSFGRYNFRGFASSDEFYESRDGRKISSGNSELYLEAGQKIYIRISGGSRRLSVEGQEFARLTTANKDAATALEVKAGWVSFTAPEDNYYTFKDNTNANDFAYAAVRHNNEEARLDSTASYALKAGDTLFIQVDEDAKMYVEYRTPAKTLDLNDHKTETVQLNKDSLEQYISFQAPRTGKYVFTYKDETDEYPVVTTFWNAFGRQIWSGDAVRPQADEEADSTTEAIFTIEKGEKVLVRFNVDKSIFEGTTTAADKKFDVSVTVREVDEKQTLTDSTKVTVKAGTTEFVKYVVPELGRYKFSVTEGSIEGIYDTNYKRLRDTESNNAYTLTLKDNTGSIKAGDTILIEVEANAPAEETKDAELSVTKVPVKELEVGTSDLTIGDGSENWYTFTAQAAGTYKFEVAVDTKKNQDGTEDTNVPGLTLRGRVELFGATNGDRVTQYAGISKTMKPGQSVVFDTLVSDAFDDDGMQVTTTAHISVTLVSKEVKPLTAGTPETVKIEKAGDAIYYSFTAKDADTYTVTWEPKETETEKSGNATIEWASGNDISVSNWSGYRSFANGTMTAGAQRVIRVTADEDKVDGTLTITQRDSEIEELKLNTAGKFDLKAGESKTFKFIAPKAMDYDVITALTDQKENDQEPRIRVISDDYDYELVVPYDQIWSGRKAQTIEITVTAPYSNDVKGEITIKPVEETILTKEETVTVSDIKHAFFKYVIPAAGRYEFGFDCDSEKAYAYAWVENKEFDDLNGAYYEKGDIVHIVAGSIDGTEQSVKIMLPKLVTIEPLNAENPITIPANGYKFYEFTATDNTTYTFSKTVEDGKNGYADITFYRNSGSISRYNDQLYVNNSISLKSGEKLFIRMTAEEAAEFKYTVRAANVLKVGENTVSVKAHSTESFRLNVYELGIYTFNITGTDDKALLSYNFEESKSSIYKDVRLTEKQYNFTVTNNADTDAANIKIIVKKIKPEAVEAGKDAAFKEVAPGEKAFFDLSVYKTGRYTVKITAADGAKLATDLGADTKTGEGTNSIWLEKNYTGVPAAAESFTVINNGETKADIKVVVTKVEPTAVKAGVETPVTIGKNESQWISFIPEETNRYTFAIDSDKVTVVKENNGRSYNVDGDAVLTKGSLYTYRLTYTPAADEESPAATVTAKVTISAVVLTDINKTTTVEIENDNEVKWIRFTADKEALYTFVLKKGDEELTDRIEYANEITDEPSSYPLRSAKYFGVADTGYIKVSGLEKGSYTLEVTAKEPFASVELTSDDKQKTVEFAVPKGGKYRLTAVSSNAGSFRVEADKGFVYPIDSGNCDDNDNPLVKDDIVTFTITSWSYTAQKALLLLEEVNVASEIKAGDAAQTGMIAESSGEVYYDFAVTSDGRYAFTGTGSDYRFSYKVVYADKDKSKVDRDFSDTEYLDLKNGDRILLTVRKYYTSNMSQYTLKVEEIKAVSADDTTAENPLELTAPVDTYYGFKTETAHIVFKAPKDGKYYISAKATDERATITLTQDDTRAYYDSEGHEYNLQKDDIVRLTVTNDSYHEEEPVEVQFKLTIKEVATDTKITAGTPVSGLLDQNENAYYVFEVPESADYVVSITSGFSCYLIDDSGNEISYLSGGNEMQWNAGDQIKLKVYSYDGSSSYKLTIKKVVASPINLGTTTADVEQGDGVYYEFKAPEDGDYIAFVNYGFYVYYQTEDMTWWNGFDAETGLSLKADDTITLKIQNSYSSEGKLELKVKKHSVGKIALGETVSEELIPNETIYYEFEVPESGNYLITKTNCELQYKIGDNDYWHNISSNDDILALEADDKVTMKVKNWYADNYSFELTVKKLVSETIQENDPKTGSEYTEYVFEAPEDDEYTVRVTNAYLQYTTGDDGDWRAISVSGTFDLKQNLTAGQTLTLRVRRYYSDSNYELVIKRNITEVTLDQPVDGMITSSDEYMFYEFTAPEDGNYNVLLGRKGSSKERPYCEWEYTEGYWNRISNPLWITEGQTVKLKVSAYAYSQSVEYTLTVVNYTADSIGLDTPQQGEISSWDSKDYEFTAPAEGDYVVSLVGNYLELQYRRATGRYWYDADNNICDIELDEGEKLLFRITSYDESDEEVWVDYSLAVKQKRVNNLTVDETVELTLQPAEIAYYTFTAQEDGAYIVSYEENGVGCYRNSDGDWYGVRNGGRFDLETGDTIELIARNYSSETKQTSLTIRKRTGTDKTYEINELGSRIYDISAGDYAYLDITAPYDQDVLVTVYGENIGCWRTDESEDDYEWVDQIWLSSEETLNLKVTGYAGASKFVVTIVSANPEYVSIDTGSQTKALEAGEIVYYQFTTDQDGRYTISLNGVNTSVQGRWSYYKDGFDEEEYSMLGSYHWNDVCYIMTEEDQNTIYLRIQNRSTSSTNMTLSIEPAITEVFEPGSKKELNFSAYGEVKYLWLNAGEEEEGYFNIVAWSDEGGCFCVDCGYDDDSESYQCMYVGSEQETTTIYAYSGKLLRIYAKDGGRYDSTASYNHNITISVTRVNYDDE